jgi:hypothetical protein
MNHVESSFSGSTLDEAGSVQTGNDGMAELQSGKTILRLGNNTKLLRKTEGELQLQEGNLLFENLPHGDSLVLMSGSGRLFVHGELGFIQASKMRGTDEQCVLIGGMAGKTKVVLAGNEYELRPGDLLSVLPTGEHLKSNFNLAKQVRESHLIHGFKHELPGLDALQKSVRDFAKLERRGFIRASDSGRSSGSDLGQENSLRNRNESEAQPGFFTSVGPGLSSTAAQYLNLSAQQLRAAQNNLPMPPTPPIPNGPKLPPPGVVGAVRVIGALQGIIPPAHPPDLGVLNLGVIHNIQPRGTPPLPPIPNVPQAPALPAH